MDTARQGYADTNYLLLAFTGVTHDHDSGLSSQRDSRAATVDGQSTEINMSRGNVSAIPDFEFANSANDFGMDDNGMHWIWDPVWDNLFDPI